MCLLFTHFLWDELFHVRRPSRGLWTMAWVPKVALLGKLCLLNASLFNSVKNYSWVCEMMGQS